jgi:hypothetical protein
VIRANDGADHARDVVGLDGLTLVAGEEDWYSFSAGAFFQGTATLSLGDHCEPPEQAQQQRLCVQLQFLTWGDFEQIPGAGDGEPDDMGEPVCGSLSDGITIGPRAGGPGRVVVWDALLVRVYRHADDAPGVGPAPYNLSVRR